MEVGLMRLVTCPCGTEFSVSEARFQQGRGKRCSKVCQYAYAQRPSGLKYTKHTDNPTSFKPGSTPWNKDTQGEMPEPWNKGIATGLVPANAFQPGETTGDANAQWQGETVGYSALHSWVDRNKTKTGQCSNCPKQGKTDWANLSHEYKRDLDDFIELCHKCNATYDFESGAWGAAREQFVNYGKRRDQ